MAIERPLIDRELALLYDVSLAHGEGLTGYTKRVLSGCEKWFAASGVSLFLRTDTGEFVLAARAGSDSKVPDDARFRPGEGIAGACVLSGEPMLVQDPKDNPLLVGKVHRRRDIGSSMVVPLITPESGCIGVLNVSRRVGDAAFDGEDLAQARPLAGHIALAVNNAHLIVRLNAAVDESRALNHKLDAIIACLGVAVIVVGASAEITHWNPDAAALIPEGLEKGKDLKDAVRRAPKRLTSALNRAWRKAAKGKRGVERAHDSALGKAWSVVGSPIPDGGVTIAIQDVTLHENAQQELARVKRLAEIGQMTAAIAHEIRNPLTGIRSAAQMVQATSDESLEFGKIIEQEALKLNSLCDQFLDFARPVVLNHRDFRPATILTWVVDSYSQDAMELGVELTFQAKAERLILNGDPLRFEQICRNLVLNALQASRPESQVVIRLEPEMLVVQDHGQGIDAEVVEKLFTPFFTTKANGTGLGLSNVRKIVDAHGWRIGVQSKPGKGTRFEVVFGDKEAA